MPLKVTINDSFTVIVICRHSTTTIISNIVIFSIVVTVVIIFFKMTKKKANIHKEPLFRQFYCGVKYDSWKYAISSAQQVHLHTNVLHSELLISQ